MTAAELRTAVRLSFPIDVEPLRAELGAAEEFRYSPHVAHYHDGGWDGVALLAQAGRTDSLLVGSGPYLPTPLLSRCPGFADLLDRLPGRKQRARLLRLGSGHRAYPRRWSARGTRSRGRRCWTSSSRFGEGISRRKSAST